MARAAGLSATVGTLCRIAQPDGSNWRAEVAGFRDGVTLLSPLDEGFAPAAGAVVEQIGGAAAPVAGDAMLGRVLDGWGLPLDGGPALARCGPVQVSPTGGRVTRSLATGVRAIDGLLTLGQGQRVGLIGGSGVGKSLLLDMLLRRSEADVVVAALIGERAREIADFTTRQDCASRARTTVIAVPASAPPAMRIRGAWQAMAVAEHFRAHGRSVLLLFDSLTRVAHAARDIGIAAGEPAVARDYPPSALRLIARLVERAGASADGRGSITGLYTVLADGDDLADPVVDTARAILDGHIVLSRGLAGRGHYPAIDLAASVSRTMPDLTSAEHRSLARAFVRDLALVERNRDLVAMGAYQPGRDAALDRAMGRAEAMGAYLRQPADEVPDGGDPVAALRAIVGDD